MPAKHTCKRLSEHGIRAIVGLMLADIFGQSVSKTIVEVLRAIHLIGG